MNTEDFRRLITAAPLPPCAALTPFEVLEVDADAGRLVLEFAAQPAFGNHFGNVQGGFAVGMVDVVVSLLGLLVKHQPLPLVECKATFLDVLPIAPCRGEGRLLRAGRRLVFTEATLVRPDGKPAVTASATLLAPGT